MSALDTLLFGYRTIKTALGVLLPNQNILQFIGATVADDPVNEATVVTIAASGPAGSSVYGGYVPGIYGDGSDGSATCDGTTSVAGMTLSGGKYTLTRDVYFVNLTINVSTTVNNGGFRIFCNGTFTCNGHFATDGQSAVDATSAVLGGGGGGAGGTGSGTGTVGAGGDGGPSGGSQVTYSFGGTGGSSGFGPTPPGGVVTPPSNFGTPRNIFSAITCQLYSGGNSIANFNGGCGGQASAGCSAGGGGGVSIVACVKLTGSGEITANGGNAITVSSLYGAGGGGGGVAILVVGDDSAWTGLHTANGGLHSTGSGGAGDAGTDGAVGTVIKIHA